MSLGDFIRACLDPPRGERRHAVPILLLRGTPGSRREAILLRSARDFTGRRPHAYITSAESGLNPGAHAYEVADLVASRLNHQVRRFGRLQFPRLLLGELALATRPKGPRVDPQRRQELIERTLSERNGKKVERTARRIESTWKSTRPVSPTSPDVSALIDGGLRALSGVAVAVARARRPGLGFYKRGYRPHGLPAFGNGADALMAMVTASADGSVVPEATELALCRALLADIHEEYARAHWFWRSRNRALVIIERGDVEPCARFLRALAEVYDEERAPVLFVVGTATRGIVEPHGLTSHPVDDVASDSSWDGRPGEQRSRGAARRTTFYAVDVDRPVPESMDEIRSWPFARRLTLEHPGALGIVERALAWEASERKKRGRDAFDRRTIMQARSGSSSSLVAEALTTLVLDDRWADARPVLVSAAAARNFSSEAVDAIIRIHPKDDDTQLFLDFVKHSLWVLDPDEDEQRHEPRLHPLASRTLLHELAQRPAAEGSPPTWSAVYEALSASVKRAGDARAKLYYDLGAGKVDDVANELGKLLLTEPADKWCSLFEDVISVPTWQPVDGASSSECARARSADSARKAELRQGWIESDPKSPVSTWLVIAGQLHADPLGDPSHELCGMISEELFALEQLSPSRLSWMTDLVQRYRSCYSHHHPRGRVDGGAREKT